MLHDGRDLLVAGVLFWLASVARVIVALVQHEVFGVESSLAFLSILFLPWLSWRSRSNRALSGEAVKAGAAEDERRDGVVLPFVRSAAEPSSGRDGGSGPRG